MQSRNVLAALMIGGLMVISAGCTTTRTEYQSIECQVPPRPMLPVVDAGELWDATGDAMYRKLEDRDAQLTGWALELEAMLVAVCG